MTGEDVGEQRRPVRRRPRRAGPAANQVGSTIRAGGDLLVGDRPADRLRRSRPLASAKVSSRGPVSSWTRSAGCLAGHQRRPRPRRRRRGRRRARGPRRPAKARWPAVEGLDEEALVEVLQEEGAADDGPAPHRAVSAASATRRSARCASASPRPERQDDPSVRRRGPSARPRRRRPRGRRGRRGRATKVRYAAAAGRSTAAQVDGVGPVEGRAGQGGDREAPALEERR